LTSNHSTGNDVPSPDTQTDDESSAADDEEEDGAEGDCAVLMLRGETARLLGVGRDGGGGAAGT